MASTTAPIRSTETTSTAPHGDFDAHHPVPKAQPLWRFALIGLGPLTALAVFALLLALCQRLA
jgi:hypothetical protein